EDEVETLLVFEQPERRHVGLLAEEDTELGNELGDETRVRSEGRTEDLAHVCELVLVRAEELAEGSSKRLSHGEVRLAPVLLELAMEESAIDFDDRANELVDEDGFTNTRIAGHEHQLRLGGAADTSKRSLERGHFDFAAV